MTHTRTHTHTNTLTHVRTHTHKHTHTHTLAGGDVLFTGSDLWVGLSRRTNQAAVNQLREFLGPACPVQTFSMEAAGSTTLHLKSVRGWH